MVKVPSTRSFVVALWMFIKATFTDRLNCRLIGLSVLCGFLLGAFTTPARAQTTIISVTGPSGPSGFGGTGIFSTQWVAVSFTVGQPYVDVTISADLIGNFGGTAYLMTSVGPGTTIAEEVASGPFISTLPAGVWSGMQPVLQDVSLPHSGTYIVVLSTTEFNPPQGLALTDLPTIVADVGASNGPFLTTLRPPGTTGVTYPPAASFFNNPTGFVGEFEVTGTPSVILVTIDIKPGGFPNSINLGASGAIPVAIFSTPTLNAPAEVDLNTLTLAGASVRVAGRSNHRQCSAEDVTGDGLADLICHFTNDLTLEPGAAMAVLEGQTYAGITIHGEDSIRIVPR